MSKKLSVLKRRPEDITHSQGDLNFEVAKNDAIVKIEVFGTCLPACPTCGEVFQEGRDLEMHSCPEVTQVNYRVPLPCSICGIIIPQGNKEGKIQCCTMDSQHDIAQPLAKYSCNRCGRNFDRRFNFERHNKRDRDCNPHLVKSQGTPQPSHNVLRCPHPGCRRTYLKPSEFAKHVKVHSSERPFTCPRCGKGYKELKSLNSHECVVNESKFANNHTCHRCGARFKRRKYLNAHLREKNECTRLAVTNTTTPKLQVFSPHMSFLENGEPECETIVVKEEVILGTEEDSKMDMASGDDPDDLFL